tara:strand:- start:5 stop:304 length:300 start_codon:yes stop_codon:yes gene_type:complete
MTIRHDAIFLLYPNVVNISDKYGIFDANGNSVAVDEDAVAKKVAELQADYDSKEYQRKRVEEYPSIGDQLDALYHANVFPSDMASKIQAVKNKYPKPSE